METWLVGSCDEVILYRNSIGRVLFVIATFFIWVIFGLLGPLS